MKQTIIFAIAILTLSISSCKKTETCATYAKETKVVKTDKVSENI